MTAPKSTFSTFAEYFEFFWNVKVDQGLRLCSTVAIVFDAQNRLQSPKDQTRARRDGSGKECPAFEVGDEKELQHRYSWGNKRNLVHYLCEKFKNSSSETFEKLTLRNNHEEADTRIFLLACSLGYRYSLLRTIKVEI